MSLDKLVNHLIELSQRHDRANDPMPLGQFRFSRPARQLVGPAAEKSIHHRNRERHYTAVLERAEVEMREKGVTVEAVDPKTGVAFGPSLSSGTISHTNFDQYGNAAGAVPKFEARVDRRLQEAVERAKAKMLEHRARAEKYEKYARAFACCPEDAQVELTVEDVHFFGLES